MMMARPRVFTIPAILEGVSPLKDGGLSLRFHTNEVNDSKQKVKVMNFYGAFGWLAFSDNTITSLPTESPNREAGAKTHSQRLRASLFVLWKTRYSDVPFDAWYDQQMEKIIAAVQSKI
jgi:hypothetical protein